MVNYNLPASSCHFNGKLYQQMHDDLVLAGMAQRTIHGYLRAVRQLADFHQKTPSRLSEEQIRQWLIHLKVNQQAAYGTIRVAFSGIKFFFTRTCRRNWNVLRETKLQNIKSLPEVLTREQVQQIIDSCTTLRMATFFWTVYSLGLRLDEARHLQVGDIDSQRMMVHVHLGKGAKDRYLPLPKSTLYRLRDYWKTHRNEQLLFPADSRSHQTSPTSTTPMSITSAQTAMKKISKHLNFGKKVSTHTLRHCCATHLLEAGVSIRAVQNFLGHSSLQTTTVYLHLTTDEEAKVREVIDTIFLQESFVKFTDGND